MLSKSCKLCNAQFHTKYSFQNFCCPQHSKSFYKKTEKGRGKVKKYEIKRRRSEAYKVRQKLRGKRERLSRFGLTIENYEEMFKNQKGTCKICKNPERIKLMGKIISLAVDHCHKTGRVRGLLCRDCNIGIALFRENKDYLSEAIKYLQNPGDED